jgi:hypothetical protein
MNSIGGKHKKREKGSGFGYQKTKKVESKIFKTLAKNHPIAAVLSLKTHSAFPLE